MRRCLMAVTLWLGAGLATSAGAQAPEPTPAGDATPTTTAPGKNGFKADELEALRYRHLWIGYGAIWLIIFGFVWRTWSKGNETARELDDLRRRLAELEGRNG